MVIRAHERVLDSQLDVSHVVCVRLNLVLHLAHLRLQEVVEFGRLLERLLVEHSKQSLEPALARFRDQSASMVGVLGSDWSILRDRSARATAKLIIRVNFTRSQRLGALVSARFNASTQSRSLLEHLLDILLVLLLSHVLLHFAFSNNRCLLGRLKEQRRDARRLAVGIR